MRTMVIAALGEIRKGVRSNWTYRVDFVGSFATLGFAFVAINFLMGGGSVDPRRMAWMALGYVGWWYAFWAITDMSWNLRGEASAGTLEQMAMGPAPLGWVLLSRACVNLLWTTAQVLLLLGGMALLFGARLPLRWQGLPVLGLTVLGVLGFGFLVVGGTLVFKRFDAFSNVLQNALLFLNGTMLPVEAMPRWMAAIARALPSTQGTVVLRRVVLDGQSLSAVWHDGSLMWLAVHSALLLAVGWAVFGLAERVAKEQGSLGQY